MKFITAIILTSLTGFVAGILSFSPWWGFAITSLLVAVLVHQKAGKAFLAGYLGIFILWGGLALWADLNNAGLLSKRIAQILPLNGNNIYLLLITSTIGAFIGGFAAMSGSYLRATAKK